MIKVEKNNTVYRFYEEFEYNKDNPEDTIFGFDICITCSGIPDFIYMVVKKKGTYENIAPGWKRQYKYEDGILTQTYKKNKEQNITKAEISEEKMKDIMEIMSNVYREDWPKIIAQNQEKNNKISQSKTKKHSEKTWMEKMQEGVNND